MTKTMIFTPWLADTSHSSLWHLCILPRYWCYIPTGSKLLKCTIINLLKQYFLLLIIFCTDLERCSNFELEANWIFYVTVFQCKWVSKNSDFFISNWADIVYGRTLMRRLHAIVRYRFSYLANYILHKKLQKFVCLLSSIL